MSVYISPMDTQPPLPLPMPEAYTFTRPLLDAWFQLPLDDYVDVRVTRRDLDALFNAFKTAVDAQDSLDTAVVRLSQNEIDRANEYMALSRRQRIESMNAFKRFFHAVMDGATRRPADV